MYFSLLLCMYKEWFADNAVCLLKPALIHHLGIGKLYVKHSVDSWTIHGTPVRDDQSSKHNIAQLVVDSSNAS